MSIFMLIDGRNGGSVDAKHPGWFELDSVQFGAGVGISGGLAGLPIFSPLTVSLAGLSPALFGGFAAGSAIPSVRIVETDGKGAVLYDLRLADVRIADDSFGAVSGTPASALTFSYGAVGLSAQGASFGYDVRGTDRGPIPFSSLPMPSVAGPDVLETSAVSQYYLVINDGTASGGASKAWLAIDSVQFGGGTSIDNTGVAGAPSFSELTISFTGAAPRLFDQLTSRGVMPSLQVRGEDSKGNVVYDLRLADVVLTNHFLSGGEGGSPGSSLSFAYDRVGLIAGNSSFGYDISDRVAVDPTSLPALTRDGLGIAESRPVTQYFMAIDGLNGGSTNELATGWFEVASLQFGAAVPATFGGPDGPGSPGKGSIGASRDPRSTLRVPLAASRGVGSEGRWAAPAAK